MGQRSLAAHAKRVVRDALRRTRPRPPAPTAAPNPEIALLAGSPLFDLGWYSTSNRFTGDRVAAAAHYLRRGARVGLSPHPLFVPDFYRAGFGDDNMPEFPFLALLSGERAGTTPSPLLGPAYLAEFPGAATHPAGVLGHFQEQVSAGRPWAPPWLPAEAGGLDAWVRARGAEFAARRASVVKPVAKKPTRAKSGPGNPDSAEPLVTVVLTATADAAANRRMIAAVKAQQYRNWEILVVCDERTEAAAAALATEERTTLLRQAGAGPAAGLGEALERATGAWIAWIGDGDRWKPHHLKCAVAHATASGVDAVCTGVERERDRKNADTKSTKKQTQYLAAPISRTSLAGGHRVEGSALLVATGTARAVGGFDPTLPNAHFTDLVLRLTVRAAIPLVPAFTVLQEDFVRARARRAYYGEDVPTVDHREVDSWHDVVLNRHLIDWDAVAARPATPGLVTIVMATYADWSMTTRAVESLVAAGGAERLQILVVDNGCDREAAVILDSLPLRFPQVEVLHNAVNHGFALGNNLALNRAEGEIVVFLNNDTEVYRTWLAPLVDALKDPEILGAQSLLLYPSGSIQAAGIVFPECGGLASPFLQGFPREDAVGIESIPFRSLCAAAVAFRRADFASLRGFDPLFRNGMEDVDLGLRLSQLRPGRFCVRTDSNVVHYESRTPGRYKHIAANRRLLLDRWGPNLPGDDVEAWERVGYSVVRHQVTSAAGGHRRLDVPTPVLTRIARASVTEGRPQLRWAIKNPAPAHEAGEHWGDTAFARQLSAALRRLGQDVVIDNKDEFVRSTGEFDDVTLLLRGLTSYQGAYGQVNLIWLISHPENFHRREAEAADLVFAASHTWAQRKAAEWNMPIEPLLQATDPSTFHPDRALPDTGERVLFVGGSRRVDRPIILEAARAELPLTVYGPDWEGRLPERFVKGNSFPNDDLGAAYRAAGVVLNDHWEVMGKDGFVSNRLFDAVAAGARVISDRVEGIEELFGRSVQVAERAGDVARLALLPDLDAVFGDDEERRRNAARIHAEHSFDVRAKSLLDGALRVRATLSQSRRRRASESATGGAR